VSHWTTNKGEASNLAVYLASSPQTTGSVVAATSLAGGLYTATITPKYTGTWLLYVTLSSTSIVGSGLSCTVLPGVASATKSIVSGLAPTTAGTATTFYITAKDVEDNALQSSGTTFVVAFQVAGVTIFSATPVYTSAGVYSVTYTPTLM
jgi:hypothetical protein